MRSVRRGAVCALALLLGFAGSVHAQTMFLTSQNVQPIFEGWQRNPDGTFSLAFGYLNRNYTEELFIPVGANNTIEPAPADRGQPTHFYARRQSFVFLVTVPADWGKKELVWTMTHAGRTSTAIGSLMPSWEIEEGVWKANRGSGIGGRTSKVVPINKPPTVTVVGSDAVTVTLPQTLTLTVSAGDDRIPGPRTAAQLRRNSNREPPKEILVAKTDLPSRNRQVGPTTQDKVAPRAAYETGLAVTWLHYRGPGNVTFEPMTTPIKPEGEELRGKATTSVRFSGPGTYVIRAVGDDGNLTNGTNITVTVRAAGSSTPQVQR